MTSAKSIGCLVFAILFVGSIAGFGLYNFYSQRFVTGGEIRMVQPSGVLPQVDAIYAGQVNVPNSEANLNNYEGRAAVLEAEAELQAAQFQSGEAFSKGTRLGEAAGSLRTAFCGFLGLMAVVVFLALKK